MTQYSQLFMEMMNDYFEENERLEKKRYEFMKKWLWTAFSKIQTKKDKNHYEDRGYKKRVLVKGKK